MQFGRDLTILVVLILISINFYFLVNFGNNPVINPNTSVFDNQTGLENEDSDTEVDNNPEHTDSSTTPSDTTPPEAVIYWDISSNNTKVLGIDDTDLNVAISSKIIAQKQHITNVEYTLTDDAGNTLKITLEHKNCTNLNTATVEKLVYNNNTPVTPPNNYYQVVVNIDTKTGTIKLLNQDIDVKQDFKIISQYDAPKSPKKGKGATSPGNSKKGYTETWIKEHTKPKVERTFYGLRIVNLTTCRGALKPQYLSSSSITVPHEYPTIQEAINNSLDGDTIVLTPGTYQENLILNQQTIGANINTLSIHGQSRSNVILDCAGGIGIRIEVNINFKFSNLTITNGSTGVTSNAGNTQGWAMGNLNNISFVNIIYGIYLQSSNHNTIEQNSFSNVKFDVFLQTSDNNQISKNTMASDYGVFLNHSNNNLVKDNLITNNNISGIFINYSNINTIWNNTLQNNNFGIQVNNSVMNNINKNTITRSKYAMIINSSTFTNIINNTLYINVRGIYLTSSNHNKIINGNWIHSTTQMGIHLKSSHYNEIKNNVIGNGTYRNWVGIYVLNSDNTKIENNNITYNSGAINLIFSNFSSILNNNIYNNYAGVDLTFSHYNNIMYNNLTDTTTILLANSNKNDIMYNNVTRSFYGIYISVSRDNDIMYNNLIDSGFAGIYLTLSNYTDVKYNEMFGNTHKHGIFLARSCLNNITDNELNNSYFSSISLEVNSDRNLIQTNYISNNYHGIYAANSDFNVFKGNTINQSKFTAVFFNHSNNNTIQKNIIDWNAVGVYLNDSNDNTLQTNDIKNCSFGVYGFQSNRNDLITNNITNIPFMGIDLHHSNHTNITNNLIDNISITGISLNRSSYANISYNTINNCTFYAIFLQGNPGSLYRNSSSEFNIVYNNTISNCFIGLYTFNSDKGNIDLNKISSCALAVMLDTSYFLDLDNNTIAGNSFGLHLRGTSNTTLTWNNIDNNTNINLFLNSTTFTDVFHNTIDASLIGVDINMGGWNNVSHNRISNNQNTGVLIRFSGWNMVGYNKLYNVNNFQVIRDVGTWMTYSPPGPPQNTLIVSPHTNFYIGNY